MNPLIKRIVLPEQIPPDALELLLDIADTSNWRRIRMFPGPEILNVCDVKDVRKRARDILERIKNDE